MNMKKEEISHSVSIEVSVTAQEAFSFLSNPENLGRWALGCWDTKATNQEGIYSGTSLFDGGKSYFRVDAIPEKYIIDYHLGNSDVLRPRISIRVIEAATISREEPCCVITISAWRDSQMDDERWHRLCATHETEVYLLKGLIEPKH